MRRGRGVHKKPIYRPEFPGKNGGGGGGWAGLPFKGWFGGGSVWGSKRDFKQEKLIECFFECNDNGTYKDIKVQIIDYRDPKDRKAREDFWIYDLDTLHPKDLSHKRAIIFFYFFYFQAMCKCIFG